MHPDGAAWRGGVVLPTTGGRAGYGWDGLLG